MDTYKVLSEIEMKLADSIQAIQNAKRNINEEELEHDDEMAEERTKEDKLGL